MKEGAAERRRRAERAGRLAEIAVAFIYQAQGYRILERRFRGKGGEIDLVALKGGLLAFVEVKMRASSDAAIFAVTATGRERIERAGRQYLSLKPHYGNFAIRYDIAAVSGWTIRLVKDAWRERP